MKPASLLLTNKLYTYEHIKSGDYEVNTPFEKSTLDFCRQWLNGQGAFAQKTSGSTGKPKIINITRTQMRLSARLTVEALGLHANDVAFVCINTAYIGGKMMLVRALEHNLKLVINEPSSNPLESIKSQVDFIAMVPLQFENSLQNHPKNIDQCKAIIIGGAPISTSLADKAAKLKTPIYSTYGMTETVSHIALKRLSQPIEMAFKIIGDVKIKTNVHGQLIINGAITNHQDIITNDTVKLLSPTTFKWLGRIDHVINSGGIKIQLEEVEERIAPLLDSMNLNFRFFLIGTTDELLGQRMVLCIEADTFDVPKNLLTKLNSNLEKYKKPKEILFIRTFIETKSGKVDRNKSYNITL